MSNSIEIYTEFDFLNVIVIPPSLEIFRKYWIFILSSTMTFSVSNLSILAWYVMHLAARMDCILRNDSQQVQIG